MISFADFSPVTLEDRDKFVSHYAKFPQVHSDNTFTNMVCWNHYAHYQYAFVGGALVLASTIEGNTKLRCPIGPFDQSILTSVLLLASDVGDDAPFTIFGDEAQKMVERLCPHLRFTGERDLFEYVYRTSDLADLPGKKYLKIRHELNRFRHKCSYRVEPLTKETIEEVEKFLLEWCEWKDCDSIPVLANEKDALLYAIRHFTDLDLSGLMIRIDGKIGAVSLYEEISADTALIHFEKGLPDCEGIYKAINAEIANILRGRYTYINRESDLGVEGLREAKMRYHPHHMVPVYSVRKEDISKVTRK